MKVENYLFRHISDAKADRDLGVRSDLQNDIGVHIKSESPFLLPAGCKARADGWE